MPTLTSDQAFQLAKLFHEVAQKLGNYRIANWDTLSPSLRTKLEGLEWTIRNYSSDFTALSIKLDLDDLDSTLSSIKGATEKMKTAIKNLEKINKIIKVATIVVTIGAAVASGNPSAIAAAVGAALTEDKKKDEDKGKDASK
jgi:hypothetical protein